MWKPRENGECWGLRGVGEKHTVRKAIWRYIEALDRAELQHPFSSAGFWGYSTYIPRQFSREKFPNLIDNVTLTNARLPADISRTDWPVWWVIRLLVPYSCSHLQSFLVWQPISSCASITDLKMPLFLFQWKTPVISSSSRADRILLVIRYSWMFNTHSAVGETVHSASAQLDDDLSWLAIVCSVL